MVTRLSHILKAYQQEFRLTPSARTRIEVSEDGPLRAVSSGVLGGEQRVAGPTSQDAPVVSSWSGYGFAFTYDCIASSRDTYIDPKLYGRFPYGDDS